MPDPTVVLAYIAVAILLGLMTGWTLAAAGIL
jgi:phosphate/sulfate permease